MGDFAPEVIDHRLSECMNAVLMAHMGRARPIPIVGVRPDERAYQKFAVMLYHYDAYAKRVPGRKWHSSTQSIFELIWDVIDEWKAEQGGDYTGDNEGQDFFQWYRHRTE